MALASHVIPALPHPDQTRSPQNRQGPLSKLRGLQYFLEDPSFQALITMQ